MQRYNPKEIEPKWQAWWQKNKTYQADLNSDKAKYIAMSMFNYPSGAGIHIGHTLNYTISDVLARVKRQQGFESYHPVGWDSFGLPAENHAIKEGVSPQESMARIIPNYHKQYQAMGWSNDWSKEIAAHTPEYYRWTQWIFSEVYRAGMVYQDSRQQWWCDKCQTVLANEQVLDDKCWRHDGPDDPIVKKREVKQWFFRITDYADELLEATDSLDWTDSVKTAQINWIGKSDGAEITFKLEGLGADSEEIKVFTTAHDTIYGATFMVLAPEHPIAEVYGQKAENAVEIEEYIASASRKSEVARLADKHKSGVQIEGLYAINPINGAKIPVWVAEYVMIGYGTGAVMAVPGEDERDHEFANKYGIPIIYTTDKNEFVDYQLEIKPNPYDYNMANSEEFDGLNFEDGRKKILEKLIKIGAGEAKVNYKIRDWSVSRQRYWGAPIPIVYCQKCGPVLLPDDQLPLLLPELDDFAPSGDGRSALARAKDWVNTTCPDCNGPAERETDTLDTYVCSSWYMLRYFDPHNDKQIFDSKIVNKWMPIDFYNGADHATAHLIYARFITRFFYKQGKLKEPEPFKKFLFNGKVTAHDGTMFSKSKGNGVDPLEIINAGYGADALRTYLMFASPLELWTRWDEQGVPGSYRFLNRVFTLVQEYTDSAERFAERGSSGEVSDVSRQLKKVIHNAIYKASKDIEELKYNTAIASLMTCVNQLYKLKDQDGYSSSGWQSTLESFTMLIAPFAPHVAEEMWHQLGHEDSVHVDHWPEYDEKYLISDQVKIAIQVNGKLRDEIEVERGAEQAVVVAKALETEGVKRHLNDKQVKKEIYIADKILNLVV